MELLEGNIWLLCQGKARFAGYSALFPGRDVFYCHFQRAQQAEICLLIESQFILVLVVWLVSWYHLMCRKHIWQVLAHHKVRRVRSWTIISVGQCRWPRRIVLSSVVCSLILLKSLGIRSSGDTAPWQFKLRSGRRIIKSLLPCVFFTSLGIEAVTWMQSTSA